MAGITPAGFVIKTLLEILAEWESKISDGLSPNMDQTPQSPIGQWNGVGVGSVSELWELAQAAYNGTDPDNAEGQQLDAICAITGTLREPAAPSTVTLTATGTPGTLLNAGRVASADGTDTRFATDDAASIAAVPAWAITTAYGLGARVTNAARVYQCITAGTSAGAGGPTTTAEDITDNTVHWKYLGEGTGAVDVDASAEVNGPLAAVAGSINSIETPVAGWSTVVNLEDADLGNLEETDEELRSRREDELATPGSSTVDALRADLLKIPDVTSAKVFHNTTMVTDVNGLPPKSVEALVQGGADADIREKIWTSGVAGGIETYGTVSGTIVDSSGVVQTVKFSRPDDEPIYIIVNAVVDPLVFPANGVDLIKAAIIEWGDAVPVGYNVVSKAVGANAFKVPGVLDVTTCYIGLAPAPASEATLVMGVRQLPLYDTSRITVNTTPGSP